MLRAPPVRPTLTLGGMIPRPTTARSTLAADTGLLAALFIASVPCLAKTAPATALACRSPHLRARKTFAVT